MKICITCLVICTTSSLHCLKKVKEPILSDIQNFASNSAKGEFWWVVGVPCKKQLQLLLQRTTVQLLPLNLKECKPWISTNISGYNIFSVVKKKSKQLQFSRYFKSVPDPWYWQSNCGEDDWELFERDREYEEKRR